MHLTASIGRSNLLEKMWTSLKARVQPNLHLAMFLLAVTLCGLIFGGIVAGQLNASDTAVLENTVQRLLGAIAQNQLASPSDLWWHRMVSDAQLLALLWLFGVSVIGLPFVVIAIFLRAFSVGFSIGFTVIQFGWKGLLVAAISIFLHQIVSMVAFISAGVLAIRFSSRILRQTYPLHRMTVAFLQYTGGFALCGLLLMAGALVQAYLAPGLLLGVVIRG